MRNLFVPKGGQDDGYRFFLSFDTGSTARGD